MRIRPAVLIAIIFCLAAFVVGQWFFFKSRFEKRLPALEQRVSEAGFSFSYAQRSIGGFPFRLEATYAGVRLSRSDPLLNFVITAEDLVLTQQLLRRDLSLLSFGAMQFAASVAAPLPQGRSGDITMAFEAPAMQSSLRSEKGRLARLSAVIERPEGQTRLANLGDFAAQQIQVHMNWPQESLLEPTSGPRGKLIMNAQAQKLDVKSDSVAPLPRLIETIQAGFVFNLDAYYPLSPRGLADWQANGGFAEMTQLDFKWGDVTVQNAQGIFRLAKDLSLQASVSFDVLGAPAMTYAIDKTDVLSPEQEELALLTLRLARAGKTAQTPVPISLDLGNDGILRLGPAPLVRFGPVVNGWETGDPR